MAIVDQSESCTLPATILRPNSEGGDLIFIRFVQLSEFLPEFVFRDVGAVRVEDVSIVEVRVGALKRPLNGKGLVKLGLFGRGRGGLKMEEGPPRGKGFGKNIHDHLLSAKERVADEFAGAQRDWLLLVGHGCTLYL